MANSDPTESDAVAEIDTDTALAPDALQAVLRAGLYPQWWGMLNARTDTFGEVSTLTEAFAQFSARVSTLGLSMRQNEDEASDETRMTGQMLCDLAREASTLLELWWPAYRELPPKSQ